VLRIISEITERFFTRYSEEYLAPIRTQDIITTTLIASIAMLGMWFATNQFGPGIGNDAVTYIAGARNLLDGKGISWISADGIITPITHFPPLMSLGIALIVPILGNAITAGLVINYLSLVANVVLVWLIIRSLTNSNVFGWVASLLFAITPALFDLHLWAMTDAPYLTLSMSAIYFMAKYLNDHNRAYLVTSGLFVGMAYLLRYAGVALYVTLAIAIILHDWKEWRKNIINIAFFTSISLTPILGWYFRNIVLTGAISTYRIEPHLHMADQMMGGLLLILDWYLPGRVLSLISSNAPFLVVTFVFVILVFNTLLGYVLLSRNREHSSFPQILLGIVALHLVAYFCMLYSSATLTVIPPRIEERTLGPFNLSLLIVVLWAACVFWSMKQRLLQVLLLTYFVFLGINRAIWTFGLIGKMHANGRALTSVEMRTSETIHAIEQLDLDFIYTDNTAALYLYSGLYSRNIPYAFNLKNSEIIFNFESRDSFRQTMIERNATLILVGWPSEYSNNPGYEELWQDMELVGSYEDGMIFQMP